MLTKIEEGYIAPILLVLSFVGSWLVYAVASSLGVKTSATLSFLLMGACHFLVIVLCVSALRRGTKGSRISAMLTLLITVLVAACTYPNSW
jgi:hypothetical protein